jgi:hypothetical protein
MKYNFYRFFNAQVVHILIGISALAIQIISTKWEISIPIFAVLNIILYLIDKIFWKYKPFSYLYWTKDFSGKYEGFLEYQFKNANNEIVTGKLKHIKIISQTGSTLQINSFTYDADGNQSSQSVSIEIGVKKDDAENYKFYYTYENEGNRQKDYSSHNGTEIIKIIFDDKLKKLEGEYYTNRLPFQTRGKFVDFKYVSNNLTHPF